MSEVFQDGEPVDSVKLAKMQADIASIKLEAASAYSLSQTTSGLLNELVVTTTKAYRVEFSNGLKPGVNTEDIEMDWTGWTDVYLTATPRGALHKFNLQWSISGGIGSFKLNVTNKETKDVTGTIKFDIIAAGTKPAVKA
jgi:hypothetical protein